MLNDIFQKLNNVQYLSLTDASSGYHNLKLNEKSSYLTTFTCQFGRYRYKRLPFRDLTNAFGITDDILVVEYDRDGKDHDDTLQTVLQVCI